MKIGDLVQLSAYGKKIQMLEKFRGDTGLILHSYFDGAMVWWNKMPRPMLMNRRDIKHARAKK